MTTQSEIYYQKAFEKFNNGDEAAWSDLAEAIRLDPTNLDYRRSRLEITYDSDMYELALEDLNKIIELSADFDEIVDAYKKRIVCHDAFGNDEELVDDINWLIENGQQDADRYAWRGSIKLKWKQFEEALEDFNQALHLAPSLALFLIDRARAYYGLGKWADAIEDLQRSLSAKYPHEAATYYWLAKAYFKLDEKAMALKYFHKFAPYHEMERLDSALDYMKQLAPDEI